MREILFRGKTALDNEWVIGAGVYKSEGHTWIITDDVTKTENRGTGSDAINPETVGQYTGLTDKNGMKIFEGDIVKREFTLYHGETKKTRETQIGVVGFKRGEFMANVVKGRGTWFGIGIVWKDDYLEIIGNIHDNPELLKYESEGEG